MGAPLLHVADLRVQLGNHPAVAGVSFDVRAGERLALVGGSGSGKTTIARTLLGLLPAHARWSGQVAVAGVNLASANTDQMRQLRGGVVGYAMQDALATLDPLQRIGSALAEAHRLHHRADKQQIAQVCDQLVHAVGLGDVAGVLRAYPHELSGGQRQRVGLALALAGRPQLLVADEPSSALDGAKTRELASLLLALAEGRTGWQPMALLLISHDMRLVRATCPHALVLEAGRIAEQGPVANLLASPGHAATRALLQHAGLMASDAEADLA